MVSHGPPGAARFRFRIIPGGWPFDLARKVPGGARRLEGMSQRLPLQSVPGGLPIVDANGLRTQKPHWGAKKSWISSCTALGVR